MKVPQNASWCVKKMLLLRPLALGFMKYVIRSHSQFLFWHDPWLDSKPILQSYNPQIVSILDSSNLATISQFIINDSWVFPITNHLWAVELRNRISQFPIGHSDEIFWQDLHFKDVQISSIWHSLRPPEPSPP